MNLDGGFGRGNRTADIDLQPVGESSKRQRSRRMASGHLCFCRCYPQGNKEHSGLYTASKTQVFFLFTIRKPLLSSIVETQ